MRLDGLLSDIIEPSKIIQEQCHGFILNDKHLQEIMRRMSIEIVRGLTKESHNNADIKCFPTFVQNLPDGTERGRFLALDLGGTNFRVFVIDLKEENKCRTISKMYTIAEKLMLGPGEKLFEYVVECLANFMADQNLLNECLPLGFTFSFALYQSGLTNGILMHWSKRFNCSGVVGKDVVQMLKAAIAKREDIQVNVCAVLNDTTGTLMSCALKNQNSKIGVIIGTGTNACYLEKIENIKTINHEFLDEFMIINTEWSNFGKNGALNFIRMELDYELDAHSPNKKEQIFEKMVSGLYIGEIVRLALENFTKLGYLFRGNGSDLLFKRNNFSTECVFEIEQETPGSFSKCRSFLRQFHIEDITDRDCANVRYICKCVSTRSADLISAGIATLINYLSDPSISVAIDGSLYRQYPRYRQKIMKKTLQLVRPELYFDIKLSEDGSGLGAAIVAATAYREELQKC